MISNIGRATGPREKARPAYAGHGAVEPIPGGKLGESAFLENICGEPAVQDA